MQGQHINLFFPQWQGGGQVVSTYLGALELKENYSDNALFIEAEVSTEDLSELKNNILGYSEICKQIAQCKALLDAEQPTTIFTIGGSCDADIPAISYLNHKLKNRMTVLWFDAHGDMHTPESSISKCFYGMPLRTLLGDGDKELLKLLRPGLKHSQVMMLGIRDLEEAEEEYISENNISTFSVEQIELEPEKILNTLSAKGNDDIYIHIDLDVFDPEEFPYVPLQAHNGLKIAAFLKLLNQLSHDYKICGMGLFEHNPSGDYADDLKKAIFKTASNIKKNLNQ